jgi:thiamine phosphate synthase YjbQ (UPF0047 family)
MDPARFLKQNLSRQENEPATQDLHHDKSQDNTILTDFHAAARKTKSTLKMHLSSMFLAVLPFVHPAHSMVMSPNGKSVIKPTISTLGVPVCVYHQVDVPTSLEGPPRQAISVEDLTPILLELLEESKMQHGTVTVISRHTTTAITINEQESRLAQDMAEYFLELAPPDERSVSKGSTPANTNIRYKHNDIHQRPESESERQRCLDNGWDISKPEILQAWRDQEPINAHSHLLSMLLGSSESIPVVNGGMVLGQWQSVLLVDLDGPRDRTVGVQLLGYQ